MSDIQKIKSGVEKSPPRETNEATIQWSKSGRWFETAGKAIAPLLQWFNFNAKSKSDGVVARVIDGAIEFIKLDRAVGMLPEMVRFFWVNENSKSKRKLFELPTSGQINGMLKSPAFIRSLPRLRRIINRPLPSIVNKELVTPKIGYNAETCEVYEPATDARPLKFIKPEDAKKTIDHAIRTIQFKEPADRLRYLCTLFDPFFDGMSGKETMTGSIPLILTIGNQSGVGKDASRELVARVHGYRLEVQPAEPDSSEFSKLLGAAMMSKTRMFHLDEPGKGSDGKKVTNNMRSVITGHLEPRLLGQSAKVSMPDGMRFSMSAKTDVEIDSDTPRRSFPIFLHAKQDALEIDWKIKDWDKWMTLYAFDVYEALQSIVIQWFQDGSPKESKGWSGQFSTWAQFVGGIVKHVWKADPFEVAPHQLLTDNMDVDSATPFMIAVCKEFEGQQTGLTFKAILKWVEETAADDDQDSPGDIIGLWMEGGKVTATSRRTLWSTLRSANNRVYDRWLFSVSNSQSGQGKQPMRTQFKVSQQAEQQDMSLTMSR